MRLYLAGGMRGIPHFNREAFVKWDAFLKEAGHEVWNPSDHDRELFGDNVHDCPKGDLEGSGVDINLVWSDDLDTLVNWAEGIAMIPGWRKSKGATAEHAVAVALGKIVIYLSGDRDESFVAEIAAIVGETACEGHIMLGVGDGTCQRWKLRKSLLVKLRSEINNVLDEC